MDNLDLYAILGVTKTSTDAEIKKVKSTRRKEKKLVLMKISLVTAAGRKKMQKKIVKIWGCWGKVYAKKQQILMPKLIRFECYKKEIQIKQHHR